MRTARTILALGLLVSLAAACASPKEGAPSPPPARPASPDAAAPRPDRPDAALPAAAPDASTRTRDATAAADPGMPPDVPLPPEARLPEDAEARLVARRLISFPSQWSGQVHVRQEGQLRHLFLGKRMDIVHTRLDLQRPEALISPYQRCLLTALGHLADPATELRRVVMIGLGGGAITRFFQIKRPGLTFHSVEIDPVVVAVARRFFSVKETGTYRSYAMDGRRFLEEAKVPYDLVILDAFDAEASLPKQLASVEFFTLVKQRLSPHGVLAMNFLVHSPKIYASVYRTLRQVFPAVIRLPLSPFQSRNVLLVAPADPARRPAPDVLRARVAALRQSFGVDFPLERCVQLADGDRPDLAAAEIIHDPRP
jgi:spermidine synthase